MTSKCYEKNYIYYNPISMTKINNPYPSYFCVPYYNEESSNVIYDNRCDGTIKNEKDEYIIINIPFMIKNYLTKYYKINSFDDFISWVDRNNHYSSKFITVIHEMVVKVYGSDIKQYSNKVIKYYYQYYQLIYENYKEKYTDFFVWFPTWYSSLVKDLMSKNEKYIISNINKEFIKKI